MSYYMMSGLGAFSGTDFNASSVWSDWAAGAAGNKAAGKRSGIAIQDGLNVLGYGPLTVDGAFGAKSQAATKAFSQAQGFGAQVWPTQGMVTKMGELLNAGATPGPNPVEGGHIVNGEYVPGAAPGTSSKASMLMLGALGLLAIGAVVFFAKKKPGSTTAVTLRSPVVVRAVPNRRRRARRNKVCGYRRRGESKSHTATYRRELRHELKVL